MAYYGICNIYLHYAINKKIPGKKTAISTKEWYSVIIIINNNKIPLSTFSPGLKGKKITISVDLKFRRKKLSSANRRKKSGQPNKWIATKACPTTIRNGWMNMTTRAASQADECDPCKNKIELFNCYFEF